MEKASILGCCCDFPWNHVRHGRLLLRTLSRRDRPFSDMSSHSCPAVLDWSPREWTSRVRRDSHCFHSWELQEVIPEAAGACCHEDLGVVHIFLRLCGGQSQVEGQELPRSNPESAAAKEQDRVVCMLANKYILKKKKLRVQNLPSRLSVFCFQISALDVCKIVGDLK